MGEIDKILETIDQVSDEALLILADDHVRRLEDEVWAELSESITSGFLTHEEAADRFLDWRRRYLKLGEIATGGS